MIGLGLTLRASGGGWSPRRLGSSLQLWLRADATFITLNGSTVSSWADQSANANTLTQGTASKQPTYNATDANFANQPSVQFDGTADALAKTGASFATRSHGHALIMPMRMHTAPAANQRYLSLDAGANDYDNVDSVAYVCGAYTQVTMQRAFATETNFSNTISTLATARVVTVAFAGGTAIMRVNGTQQAVTDTYADVTNVDYTRITLGALALGAANFSPLVTPEVVLTHIGSVSDASIAATERYMGLRYGITVA